MTGNKKHKILKLAVGKVKMYDAAHDHRAEMESTMKAMPDNSKHYPSLSLSIKEAPVLKGYEVGHECTLLIKARVVSHDSMKTTDSSSDHYRLEIHSIGKANLPEASKDSNY